MKRRGRLREGDDRGARTRVRSRGASGRGGEGVASDWRGVETETGIVLRRLQSPEERRKQRRGAGVGGGRNKYAYFGEKWKIFGEEGEGLNQIRVFGREMETF